MRSIADAHAAGARRAEIGNGVRAVPLRIGRVVGTGAGASRQYGNRKGGGDQAFEGHGLSDSTFSHRRNLRYRKPPVHPFSRPPASFFSDPPERKASAGVAAILNFWSRGAFPFCPQERGGSNHASRYAAFPDDRTDRAHRCTGSRVDDNDRDAASRLIGARGGAAQAMTRLEREFVPGTQYDAERLPFAKRLEELLPGECIWPINSGGPYLFCAAKTKGKYCPHHKARLLQKKGGHQDG